MFLFTSILLSLTVGLLLALILTSGIEKWFPRVLAVALIASAFGTGVAGLLCLERKSDEHLWNGGNCTCGEEWRLVSVDHIKNGGDLYYYTCDECNNTIRTHSNMK